MYKHNPDGTTGELIIDHANELFGVTSCGATIDANGSIEINQGLFEYEKKGEFFSSDSQKIRLYSDPIVLDWGLGVGLNVVEIFKNGGYRLYTEGLEIEYWCTSNFYDQFRFPTTAIYPDSLNGNYHGQMSLLSFDVLPDYMSSQNYCELSTNPLGIELFITSYPSSKRQLLKKFVFQTYDLNEALKDGETYTLYDRNPLIDEENASSLYIYIGENDFIYIRVGTGRGSYVDTLEPYLNSQWEFSCSLIKD